jgi:hypothetical protein
MAKFGACGFPVIFKPNLHPHLFRNVDYAACFREKIREFGHYAVELVRLSVSIHFDAVKDGNVVVVTSYWTSMIDFGIELA